MRAIVLLAEFPDQPAQVPPEFFDSLLFIQNHFRNGNLWEYYKEVSYGKCIVTTEDLPSQIGWLMMPQNYSYYANGQYGFGSYPQNAQKLVEDAIVAADPYVDFSRYDIDGDGYVDALFVVHTGPGAEYTGSEDDIWSHAWYTHQPISVDGVYCYRYSMEPEYYAYPGDMKVGVFAHEMGHSVFGLPDMYDYGYDSEGLGYWSLMAAGAWGGGGRSPAHPDAWCRYKMGFLNVISIKINQARIKIYPVEDSSICYRLWKEGEMTSQYFLVTYRKKKGYDQYVPGEGLLIYHCDDNMSYYGNDYQWIEGESDTGALHYLCALEQADGNFDLERNRNAGDAGDPWPGTSGKYVFDSLSYPSSKDYHYNNTKVKIEILEYNENYVLTNLYIGVNPLKVLPDTLVFTDTSLSGTVKVTNLICDTIKIDSIISDSQWVAEITPQNLQILPYETSNIFIRVDTNLTSRRITYSRCKFYFSGKYEGKVFSILKLRLKAPLIAISPDTLFMKNRARGKIIAKSVGELNLECDTIIPNTNLITQISPYKFMLPPGDSIEILLEIDTSKIDTGRYLLSMTLYTNDAIKEEREAFIKLIKANALIESYPGEIIFDITDQPEVSKNLYIRNSGNDTMYIDTIYADVSWLKSITMFSSMVLPGRYIRITLTASVEGLETGTYYGKLYIVTNAKNEPIHIKNLTLNAYSISEKNLRNTKIKIQNICWKKIRIISEKNLNVKIYDITGKCLFNGIIEDVSKLNLPSGVYFVKIPKYGIREKVILLR